VFGHLRESKRLSSVLHAFQAVRPGALLVAGDVVSLEYERAIAPLLGAAGVIRVPSLPEPAWWLHAHAADVCVNLRYPPAGETSGIAVRMMGIGKPVVMTSGEETDVFPDMACVRVDSGAAEVEMLAATMAWLAGARDHRLVIGDAARRHIREQHDPERVAALYWRVLEECSR